MLRPARLPNGGPLAVLSCNPPVQESGFLTVGTNDANGAAPNSVGSVRLGVMPGDPSTPGDQADVVYPGEAHRCLLRRL